MKQKLAYLPPSIEVVALENEGVIAASGASGASGNEGYGESTMSGYYKPGNASGSDLEDMINDILTVE